MKPVKEGLEASQAALFFGELRFSAALKALRSKLGVTPTREEVEIAHPRLCHI
jgi:hypothetical protein